LGKRQAAIFDLFGWGWPFYWQNLTERRTPMSVESLEQVIKLWDTGQITAEQAIGKLLLILRNHDHRLSKLEAKRSNPNESR
jgi:hypothetical protein